MPSDRLSAVDYFALINALLNGVVMMGMATTITVTVAKYFMCGDQQMPANSCMCAIRCCTQVALAESTVITKMLK